MRHLLSLADVTAAEMARIFEISADLKARHTRREDHRLLQGRVAALLFQKPSLRTRVSFEAGMAHLGGSSMMLGEEAGWGKREATCDFSRVLSEYVDVVIVRANEHQAVEELASFATSPVINALTDYLHPCQALADLFTLRELRGELDGLKIAFVGDGNNVARSLAIACGHAGVQFTLAGPQAYTFTEEYQSRLKQVVPDLDLNITEDVVTAVKGVDAIYTDVWTSMGQDQERKAREQAFAPYQVNAELMKHAPNAYFMHDLPAKRGLEVTDEVIDSPNSVIVQQAANRMYAQKGLLVWLLTEASV
ncbi:MAG: ornithine carbamoyltransferase [Pirellulales bacterium]|nr:ornithine carbamoyltransferase [Pirellulales bacterium]